MANVKISQLPAIDSVADADLVPLVDASAAATKKATIAQIAAAISALIGGGGGGGSTWRHGTGAPSDGLGANGDFYLDTATDDVYAKASGSYSLIGNFRGADGADGTNGTNGTNGADGADGADGEPGPGLDAGGSIGQIPVKSGSGDFETEWSNAPVLKGHRIPVATLVDGATVDINAAASSAFRWSLAADRTATFNAAGEVDGLGFVLQLTANGHSVDWPSNVVWIDGGEPTFPPTGVVKVVFTWDSDTSKWLAAYCGPVPEVDVDGLLAVEDGVYRSATGADVPTTGLKPAAWITQRGTASHTSPAMNLALNNLWAFTVGGNASPTFSNAAAGMPVEIMIDSSGAYTWTWPVGLTLTWWEPGPLPTTLAAKKYKVKLYFTSSSAAEAHYAGSTV